jgi:hypothetical protein
LLVFLLSHTTMHVSMNIKFINLPLKLSGEIIYVYSDNPTEHINTVRGHTADKSNVRAGGIYSYHCALNA